MQRNYSVDILKGICIIFIVVTHFHWSNEQRLMYLFPFWIGMAVPVFMMLSGYVGYLSYERLNAGSFLACYSPGNVVRRLKRILIPFSIVFVIEYALSVVHGGGAEVLPAWRMFLTGGLGPGSYYTPVMIQFVLLFPFIFFSMRKSAKQGLLIALAVNVLFELVKYWANMPESVYRLLIFRYVFVIGLGSYIAARGTKIERFMKRYGFLCLFVGIFSIVMLIYENWVPFFLQYWTPTSFLPSIFVFPIIYLALNMTIRNSFLELCGKASFHIFLVQMTYYCFANDGVGRMIGYSQIHLLTNCFICIIVGIGFYFFEERMFRFYKKMKA